MHKLKPVLAVPAIATPALAALGLATASALGAPGASPALAAARDTTSIVDCAGHAHATPRTLTLFCGDGNDTLTALTWSAWGTGHATATGFDVVDNCEPSCAAGHDHRYRVTVSATDPKRSGKGQRYTRLTVTFPRARPPKSARVEHFDLTAQGPEFA